METRTRIRLAPPDETRPRLAVMPVDEAQRWNSRFDAKQDRLAVLVFVTQSAYARICVHTASDLDNEVGGVLVGQRYLDEAAGEQFVVTESVIPACYTRQGPVYLTFTQDSLVYFHTTLEQRYPGKRIVGWYHTHPRMGIFLSHYDTWLHGSFFSEPWQVALVVEPHTSTAGFFVRQANGILDPTRYFGFYELNGAFGHSLMHWQNLYRAREEREQKSP
ncbi:MAG: hypothetical protein Q8N45_05325 [Anaerolineales bacterium]|nr:hypothetical protein [Anaerolineales bacterium]MDP3183751.1 hypothetical protein [Anaerolineales bacterium]